MTKINRQDDAALAEYWAHLQSIDSAIDEIVRRAERMLDLAPRRHMGLTDLEANPVVLEELHDALEGLAWLAQLEQKSVARLLPAGAGAGPE
jgi:hypothetical protein